MSDALAGAGVTPMRLPVAAGIYLGCFCMVATMVAIGLPWVIAYVAAGLILNRLVLRRLIEWHPVYDTLQNVSSGKLRMFVFWPLAYPALFVRLTIARVL